MTFPAPEDILNPQELARFHEGALKFIGKKCPHGHKGVRYVKGGGCVDCAELDRERRRVIARSQDFLIDDEEVYFSRTVDQRMRAAAAKLGLARYSGRTCRKCGTAERYTNRGACVCCVSKRNRATYEQGCAVEELIEDMFG